MSGVFTRAAAIAAAALALTGCASSGEWTRADTARELAFVGAIAADAWQTSQIAGRADLVEGEPLARAVLGREPSKSGTAVYFATLGVSHFLIARALPAKWRPWFQSGTLAYEGLIVSRNCMEHDLC